MIAARRVHFALTVAVIAALIAGCGPAAAPSPGGRDAEGRFVLRVGHFPTVTHVQAMVARSFTREGRGWFESRLGPNVAIEWFAYNAGPSAVEAVFARSLDLAYAGPNPVINGYSRANGSEIRVIAGALRGGSGMVVQGGTRLARPDDFRGRRIGTPQLGNTQDVAARAWLTDGGLKIGQLGGDAFVIPTANADQLPLFKQRQLDAVWTVEPWLARLELEAGAYLLIDDRESITAVLISSVALLRERRDLAQQFVAAHRELTAWISANPEEAQRRLIVEIAEQTRGGVSAAVIARAWPRLVPDAEISLEPFVAAQRAAVETGLLRRPVDLGRLVEVP